MDEYSINLIRTLIQMNIDYGFKMMNIRFDTDYTAITAMGSVNIARWPTEHTTEITIEIDKTKENKNGVNLQTDLI